jgi:hypothetical protein
MKAGSFKASIFKNRIITFLVCIATFLLWQRSAYANEPIFVGFLGSSPILFVSGKISWLTFVVVVLIEAVVFIRLLSMKWWKGLWASFALNAFSSVFGFLIGALGFSVGEGIPIVLGIVVVSVINVLGFKSPKYYKAVTVAGIIVGFIGLGFAVYAFSWWHLPPILVFILFIIPLVFGFGLTLWLEGLIAGRFLDPEKKWQALMKANLFSYLFLIVMLLLFSSNPYKYYSIGGYHRSLESRIESGAGQSEIINMLHDRRASKFYVFGLSRDNMPGPNYEAYQERRVIRDELINLYDNNPRPDFELGLAIVDDALQIPTLTPDAAEQLEKAREYFSFCLRFSEAKNNSDDTEMAAIANEYSDWWNSYTSEHGDDYSYSPTFMDFQFTDPSVWQGLFGDNPRGY